MRSRDHTAHDPPELGVVAHVRPIGKALPADATNLANEVFALTEQFASHVLAV